MDNLTECDLSTSTQTKKVDCQMESSCIKKSEQEYHSFLMSKVGAMFKQLPTIFDGRYFQIVEFNAKTVKAVCMNCSKANVLSASLDSTTNLLLSVNNHGLLNLHDKY